MSNKFVQLNAEAITKQIAAIGRATVKLSGMIQAACIQVIGHAFTHGDVTVGTRLVEAVGSHDRAAVAAFLEKYGPFAWSKQDKRFLHFPRKDVVFDEEYIASLPMWESAKRPPEIKSVYDMDAESSKFLDRMSRLAKDPNITLKDKELLSVLVEARNKFVARKYLGEAADTPVLEHELVKLPAVKAA